MNNEEYRDLVLGIYQAVSDPDEWQPVLDRVTELVDATGCLVFEWHLRDSQRRLEIPLMSSTYDPAQVVDYFERNQKWEAQDHDIFDRQLMSLDHIELLSEEILYDDKNDYLSRPHVKELLSLGIRYRTGALLDKDNPFRARFSLAFGEDRGPLKPGELAILQNILPHLAKALELSRPVGIPGEEHRALLAVMDRLNIGVCLIDAWGRIAQTNTEFERQADSFDFFFKDPKGRLKLRKAADQRMLNTLLQDALHHGRFGARPRKEAIFVDTDGVSSTLCVEIVPIEKLSELGSRAFSGALLLSRDTRQPVHIDIDLLKRAFDLTHTESAVVEQVCQGLTNAEIAEQRERSVETINAQMKSVLGKTKAANRTQLVRLLCNYSLPGTYFLR